ncbi:MAG: CHASE domain-containing protein [Sulfurisoma sp.]|nr:CHASE domain-containing protein [Sulfurisoma sp.]
MDWLRHRIPILLVLAVSLGVTWLLWRHEHHNAALDLQARLDADLRDVTSRIEQRMAVYEQMLRGAQGLFAASGDVGRNSFRTYVESLQLGADFAGIEGVGLARIVSHAQREGHVAALRRQGFPDYAIRPGGVRAIYAPIVQLEPFVGRNRRVLGRDPYATAERRSAMDQARDSGTPAITGKITLALESDTDVQPGFAMFLPIYGNGMPRDTIATRRASIIGWVIAPIRMNNFMASLYGERPPATDITIYDGLEMSDRTLLFDSAGSHGKPGKAHIAATEYLQIAGHTWTLAIRSLPGFDARAGKDKSDFIAIAGIGLSVLLTLLAHGFIADSVRRKQSEEKMSALSRHLVAVQEGTRRRLSGELHDRTSPNLAAIGINLDVIAAALPEAEAPDLGARLEDTRALIEDTTASIREICADLRPPVLDYAGLPAALESYAGQFGRRTGIAVRVDCAHGGAKLAPELESALFRIVQEALTNCAKHARATSIGVILRQDDFPVRLTVVDDGSGFDLEQMKEAAYSSGLGIITMRELAEFFGGKFTIESNPGKGTRIDVEI